MKITVQSKEDRKLSESLSHLENNLDEATHRELMERRRMAFQTASSRPSRRRWLLPAVSAAFASLMFVVLSFSLDPSLKPDFLDIYFNKEQTGFLTTEKIELYDNIEFYSWLADSTINERS